MTYPDDKELELIANNAAFTLIEILRDKNAKMLKDINALCDSLTVGVNCNEAVYGALHAIRIESEGRNQPTNQGEE